MNAAPCATRWPATKQRQPQQSRDHARASGTLATGLRERRVRFEHNDSFGNAAVPRGSIAWSHTARAAPSARPGSKQAQAAASRSPPSSSRSAETISSSATRSLEPERSRTIDAGIEQRLSNDRVKLDLTWFNNHYRNIISTRTLSFDPFRSQYFNIGAGRARGVELTGEIAPSSTLRVHVGYTMTASEVTDSAGRQQLRVRRRTVAVSEASPLRIRGSLVDRSPGLAGFVRRRSSGSESTVISPRWNPRSRQRRAHDVGLRASYELSRRFAITAAIDNLTNADYMEPLGYPALGRAFRVGIRAGF